MTPTPSRIHVVSEGVLASYIHDISSRNPRRPAAAESAPRRRSYRQRVTNTQQMLSYTAK